MQQKEKENARRMIEVHSEMAFRSLQSMTRDRQSEHVANERTALQLVYIKELWRMERKQTPAINHQLERFTEVLYGTVNIHQRRVFK